MRRRVAIVGAGITLFRRRMLESPKELSFEASKMALDSAGLTLKDIQSVVSGSARSEEHTSELQSRQYLVCRLLLEKKKKNRPRINTETLTRPGGEFASNLAPSPVT